MKKDTCTATFDEIEMVVGYTAKEHWQQLNDDPPYTERWMEIELESAEVIVFGRGFDLLPIMSRKEKERLHSLVREKHESLLDSLAKVIA